MAVPRLGLVQGGDRVNSGFISPIRLAEMNRTQQATSQHQASQPPPQPPQAQPPPRGSSPQHPGHRLSSFFSSFRSNSRTSDEANTQAASMSGYDELGRRNNDRPQPTRNQTHQATPSKLQSQRARGHSGSGSAAAGSLQRRTTLAVAPPPQISAGKTLHPEIEQVVALTLAHSSKIYCSGPLTRKIERQSDGQAVKPHESGWSDVWAQLGGTTMSVWDMQAINKASQEGKEVPPSYLNVTDSHVQVHGSMTSVIPGTNQQARKSNIVALNTAGENLIVFSCETPQSLVSWATAFRLASWEKSRIEEIYTGHLLRLSLVENDQFREPHTTLVKGRMEGWAEVRVGGTTEWQRVWFVVSAVGNGSIDAGRPGSTSGTIKRNRMSTIFGKGSSYNNQTPQPTITLYTGEKAKDRKRLKYTLTNVTQAFAVYPERPEIIQSSTLFKVEATVQDEEIKQNERERRPAQDRYLLVMPETDPTRPGSTEMLKWLVAIHDAFGLYGRPEGYVWDPRDHRSMFFTYPVGPYRDHLFLDRELAEVLDAREHSTSKVRAALTGILVDRLRGPPPPPLQMRGPQQQGGGVAPQLPELGFENGRPRLAGPSASFQGQVRLSPIEDHSTTHESQAPSTLLPNPLPQSQSPPTSPDEQPNHQYQSQAPPSIPTSSTSPTPTPTQPRPGESTPMHSSASLQLPESMRTATPPESVPTATPSRRLSPPVRGDTLPVNLSHSRMPTTVDGLEVPVNNGLMHSSPEQMLAPLSAASLSSRSMTSVNIPGAPPGSSDLRSLSVPPPESSTSSTPKTNWQRPSGPPPGLSELVVSPPNVSPPNSAPPAPRLNIAPPPGPPPSGIHSSQPPSQAETRRQDTSHDYQLLNEAAVSYLRQLEDEDELSAQPQVLPPRLAALEASNNTNMAMGTAHAHTFTTATASGSLASQPPAPAIGNKTAHLDQTSSSASSYSTSPDNQLPPQSLASTSKSMSQHQRPQQYDGDGFDTVGALAALTFAETPPQPQYPPPPPIPNEEVDEGDGPTESESDAPNGTHARSSFATGDKAAQRKARVQAHQAATQEALHRPGRPNGKVAGKRPVGAWGSSDEEEEEEEEDDEDEPPRSNNRTPSNFDHGQPSIVSPQPRQYYNQGSQPSMGDYAPYSSAHLDGVQPQQQPQQRTARMLPQPPDMARGQSPYRHQESSRQSSGTDQRRHLDPHDDPRGRRMYDDQPRSLSPNRAPPPQLVGAPSRPVWSTVLDPDHDPKAASGKTFVTIEANETMTKAFTPQGLLQAGIQDKQDRSAKRQEELARESGASLINVPHKPPPPQTGLLGAVTAHERERKREGGVGAVLTERERERRMAEERQRKFDEMQRQQLDQMTLNGQGTPNGAMEMYNPASPYPMMNPMMMNPMMWGMNPMMMMGGYGMPPPPVGMGQMNPQQMWAAQQAAMQAYQNAMMTFSQAASDAGNGTGGGDEAAAGGQRAMSPMPGGWGGMGMMPGMMAGYGMGMPGAPGSTFLQPGGQQGRNTSPTPGEGARISMALSNSNSPNLSPARGGTPQVQ